MGTVRTEDTEHHLSLVRCDSYARHILGKMLDAQWGWAL